MGHNEIKDQYEEGLKQYGSGPRDDRGARVNLDRVAGILDDRAPPGPTPGNSWWT